MNVETQHHVPPVLLERARAMRHELWQCLRGRQLFGFKFRRQQPLGRYIADFFCAEVKLVVELDGESHGERQAYDERRTKRLMQGSLNVIRFENDDVFHFLDTVLEEILKECERLQHAERRPPSPLVGEGGGEG